MARVYGPVPSRRLGLSLGISPIPPKTCNYSCIYCQLGRTNRMTNLRRMFFPVEELLQEFTEVVAAGLAFDAVTIVGEGEPTLYSGLGLLIDGIKEATSVPVAVITNGALLYEPSVRQELCSADIVMPSLDAYDSQSFQTINRPYGEIKFDAVYEGLQKFCAAYKGQRWIEIMLVKGYNDSVSAISKLKLLLSGLDYDCVFINTPIRPPAETYARPVGHEVVDYAVGELNGTAIVEMVSEGFYSVLAEDYDALISIISRHPMKTKAIKLFLAARGCQNPDAVVRALDDDPGICSTCDPDGKSYRIRLSSC